MILPPAKKPNLAKQPPLVKKPSLAKQPPLVKQQLLVKHQSLVKLQSLTKHPPILKPLPPMIGCSSCKEMFYQDAKYFHSKGITVCNKCENKGLGFLCHPLVCWICNQSFSYEEYIAGDINMGNNKYRHHMCVENKFHYIYGGYNPYGIC